MATETKARESLAIRDIRPGTEVVVTVERGKHAIKGTFLLNEDRSYTRVWPSPRTWQMLHVVIARPSGILAIPMADVWWVYEA